MNKKEKITNLEIVLQTEQFKIKEKIENIFIPKTNDPTLEEQLKKAKEGIDNSIVVGSGDILLPLNDNDDITKFGNIIGTTSKCAKEIIIKEVRDEEKREYIDPSNNIKHGIKLSQIQKIAVDRSVATTKSDTANICDFSKNYINEIQNLPEVKLQVYYAKDNIKKLDTLKKENKKSEATKDEITGEKLGNQVEIHHKIPISIKPDYLERTSDKNYMALNKETHKEGHKTGILDDQSLSEEEKKDKLRKHLEKKRKESK